MLDSAPPASITSARPVRIASVASPSAWFPDAQAVVVHETGPRRPSSIEAWAAPMFGMIIGMKSGDTRSGPRSSQRITWSTNVVSPPMPLPTIAPARGAIRSSTARAASASARRPAATASWLNRSIRRAARRSMKSPGAKSFTSQAMVVSVSTGS